VIGRLARRIARPIRIATLIAAISVTLAACSTGAPDIEQPATSQPQPTVTPAG
jgi:hypothetical protein